MKRSILLSRLFAASFIVFCAAFGQAEKTAVRAEPIQPIPPVVIENKAKVDLGRMLFFDPRLSKSGFISCNSCHNLGTGGVDGLPSSIGHGWQLGPINSPTVFNAKFNVAQFWDGRAKDLVEQAGGPIANPGEMASTHELAVDVLNTIPGYRKRFKEVFGEEEVEIGMVQDAIATFEETLVTPDSKFDRWLKGDDEALSEDQLAGYQLFKTKGCVACHNGVAVGASTFQKFGVVKPYRDTETLGRYNVTKNEADKYVFKVPTLRNVALTAPYFHDGSVWSLGEAVNIMAEHQLGQELSKDETRKIVAFLRSLTGKQPRVVHPVLPPSTAKTPRPDPDAG